MAKLEERSHIVIDEKGESGTNISELLQMTRTKVEGVARDLPVIGRWKSKAGDVSHMATGAILP
jgi:hypothetical protein